MFTHKADRCRANLFLIGAMKSGSSSLARHLRSHPSIFMASRPKEPSYFVDPDQLEQVYPSIWEMGFWKSEERYLSLFDGAEGCAVIGEASQNYARLARVTGVAERIAAFNPDARFLYIMRDPVRRTISHYWYMVNSYGEGRPMLTAVREDPDYTDDNGEPLPLAVDGTNPSFQSLFSAYGGDTPEQTLARELLKAGSVEEDSKGRYVAKRRYHMPVEMDTGGIRFFGTNLFDHANTLSKNVTGGNELRWLEGFAVDDHVHPNAVEDFRAYIDERGQQFLEEIDDWLSQHRLDPNESETTPVRLGLGVYAIEGQLPEGT